MTAPSKAVLVSDAEVVLAGPAEIEHLRMLAADTPLKRARLCAHREASDAVHEMLIVLDRRTYVQPHRHPGKTVSFHVIDGTADVVLFDEEGSITSARRLGPYGSEHPFYCRLNAPFFYTLLVRSTAFVVQETTSGPFEPPATVYAPWAPAPAAIEARTEYMAGLEERVSKLQDRS